MTEAWNGRPPAPLDERDGWHWLRHKRGQSPFPINWVSETFSDAPTEWKWDVGDEGDGCPDVMSPYFDYVAPVLTPDQIAAQIAEAVKAEREACAKVCDAISNAAGSEWRDGLKACQHTEGRMDALDVMQAALESVSDYETPRHAREMAEDMMPAISKAGWQIVRIPPQATEGGHG